MKPIAKLQDRDQIQMRKSSQKHAQVLNSLQILKEYSLTMMISFITNNTLLKVNHYLEDHMMLWIRQSKWKKNLYQKYKKQKKFKRKEERPRKERECVKN